MGNHANIVQMGTLISAILSWPAGAIADVPVPQFAVGQPLSTAHQQLLEQGWSVSTDALNAGPKPLEAQHLQAQLPSLITCSGTGAGLCAYGYSRQGQNLKVVASSDGPLLRWQLGEAWYGEGLSQQ